MSRDSNDICVETKSHELSGKNTISQSFVIKFFANEYSE